MPIMRISPRSSIRTYILGCLLIICTSIFTRITHVMAIEPYSTSVFLFILIPTPVIAASSGGENYQKRYKRTSDFSSSHSQVAYGTNKVMGDCVGRDDETLCDPTQGGVCRNHTCISACSSASKYYPRLQPCVCSSEDDSFCYLCCGSSNQLCAPAHEYHVFKPNGEYWERQVCSRCRTYQNNMPCDERNPRRVCHNNKCVASICHGKPEGWYCRLDQSRVCADDECRDPCNEHDKILRLCECDLTSEDRCELCCYHAKTKKCENAYQKYKIKNRDGRMILRVGLNCKRGLTCNKYGVCSAISTRASIVTASLAFIIHRLFS